MKKLLFLILIIGIGIFSFLSFGGQKTLPEVRENPKIKIANLSPAQQNSPSLKLKLVANPTSLGQPEFVFVSGDYAYLASGFSGLEIFDVSHPQNPKLISNFDTPGYAEGAFVKDNFAYISDKSGGFLIIDVSDPESPKLLSRYKPISSEGVFVKGQYAFLAYSWWGAKIFDVSNPRNPSLVWEKDLPDEAEAIFVEKVKNPSGGFQDYLFLGKGNWSKKAKEGDFQIFDISNIKKPKLIYTHRPSSGYVESIFVKDNYLFLAADTAGLQIYDVSNPYKPVFLSSLKIPGSAESVFVSKKYAFLAAGTSGLQVVDISDPKNPKLVSHLEIPGFSERVFVSGNYVYLAVKTFSSLANTNTKKQKGRLYIVKINY